MLQELRIDIPELEPDPVLLTQLSRLSASSVPHRRDGPVRALVAGVTVLVLVGFSWLTGALPGVASPFDGVREQRPAPQHAPKTSPTPDPASEADAALPGQPAALPPGQTKPHTNNGNHYGQTRPHTNNGNHYGQTKPHTNNGHHLGQTKPHTNNGHHLGQTKPHHDGTGNGTGNGHHNGQTKPHHDGTGNGQTR